MNNLHTFQIIYFAYMQRIHIIRVFNSVPLRLLSEVRAYECHLHFHHFA